jgi:dienelactone hydrolase
LEVDGTPAGAFLSWRLTYERPPCATIGCREELDGYRAALQALREHPTVDRDRIFLVGISLGGVFAPILANETPVAGISAWGTIAFAPGPYPGRSERFFQEFAAVDVLAIGRRLTRSSAVATTPNMTRCRCLSGPR